ncbi:thymidylate synthase [Komagataeibacter sp. FNDCR1]|nr:thymidylate synthase [Komagataeibacter sp. FNDCR1]
MKEYHRSLSDVLIYGRKSKDRTGVGTRSLFGASYSYDISTHFPLVTTKFVPLRLVMAELFWFLSGCTNIRPLLEQNCHIWSEWPHDKYVRETGDVISIQEFESRILGDDAFAARWGDLGPVYGHQWRSWEGANGQVFDQVSEIIRMLKARPYDRGIIMSGWNVADLGKMALRPCHTLYQWKGWEDGTLDCVLYQRSGDAFLGVPFNIASATLLTHMLAKVTGHRPGRLTHHFADLHIYDNHVDQVNLQLGREPYELPRLRLDNVERFEDFTPAHVHLEGYRHHPAIKAPVAV